MKKITFYLSLIFSLINLNLLQANPDTLIANITTAQGHDTILAYAGNPNFVILDVRTPGEYVTHIEGAVNIDYNNANFSTILDSLNKGKVYLIHCASGSRSALAKAVMQTKHFRTVYNMLGGISGWNTAGYPTTTFVAPEFSLLTDSVYIFNDTPVGHLDSVLITVTNSKNSVLQFSSSTNISGSEYSSQLQNTHPLLGARDFSFYIYYLPANTDNDSIAYTIESSAGNKNVYIYGKYNQTGINTNNLNNFKVFANKSNNSLVIFSDKSLYNEEVQIFDLFGRLLYSNKISGNHVIVKFNNEQSGLLLIKISSKTEKIFW
ncbi:MAG: rhodanese-like domain-containing protein [Bacteroidia bacterium]|nr:rhodanese-like domain-containing protein [Bacteroidia bacterium]